MSPQVLEGWKLEAVLLIFMFSSSVCQEALEEEGGLLFGKKVFLFGCTERKLFSLAFLLLVLII